MSDLSYGWILLCEFHQLQNLVGTQAKIV